MDQPSRESEILACLWEETHPPDGPTFVMPHANPLPPRLAGILLMHATPVSITAHALICISLVAHARCRYTRS